MTSAWPVIEPIRTALLHLEPLSPTHAAEMTSILADPALYRFTGDEPPSLPALERRYAAQRGRVPMVAELGAARDALRRGRRVRAGNRAAG